MLISLIFVHACGSVTSLDLMYEGRCPGLSK